MTAYETDVAILGGGAAGLAAAREARRRGASATIVTDGPLGGDCTFTGCVPSKTVIEASHAGLSFQEAFQRTRDVIDHIAQTETADVLRREGVQVIEGVGTLRRSTGRASGPSLRVDGIEVRAKGVVLALGGRPQTPSITGLADVDPLTSENLWDLEESLRSVAVIGGGAIGCELGHALSRLGVAVSLIELADRVLVAEEPASSGVVQRSLEAAGVDVRTGVAVTSASRCGQRPGGVELRLSDGSLLDVERVLVAVGRRPNTDRGGLQDADISLDDRGFIATGSNLSTSADGVYAAGDITGLSPFTHAADRMGRLAAANIVSRFHGRRFDPMKVPAVTFTSPEVASIGLTEEQAATRYENARVAELPLDEHDRAIVANRTEGFIKLIAAPNPVIGSLAGGRLVGASIVADRAGEMIAELSLAMEVRAFVGRLAMATHPYPTWSYGIPKAAAQFFTTVEGRTARAARLAR
ncbi:MAG: dihydrolipoyl dehydrogenase family protein [Acidimicrobiales bacterium]